ncbi:MAG: hypothetical protein ACI87A_002885 [Planctomycetota bacterium]
MGAIDAERGGAEIQNSDGGLNRSYRRLRRGAPDFPSGTKVEWLGPLTLHIADNNISATTFRWGDLYPGWAAVTEWEYRYRHIRLGERHAGAFASAGCGLTRISANETITHEPSGTQFTYSSNGCFSSQDRGM